MPTGGKGPGVLIALGAAKPKGEEDAEPSGKGGALSAAKALLKALKAEDASGVDEALRLHYELCAADHGDDE